jgi:hypothetical protein
MADDDGRVGYKRPPKHTQFSRGRVPIHQAAGKVFATSRPTLLRSFRSESPFARTAEK